MYRFVQKNRWIPSLHLLAVALWILAGSVLSGYAHREVRHPLGVSVVTDFAGDDLQRVAGGKELSEELKVETEADESGESDYGSDGIPVLDEAFLIPVHPKSFWITQSDVLRPSAAKFPQPKTLYLEYEVFRI
ncbi:MAG: hypothetical protein ACKOX0_02955 [Bacteroidota bacterium]